jgi:hypothetical protein
MYHKNIKERGKLMASKKVESREDEISRRRAERSLARIMPFDMFIRVRNPDEKQKKMYLKLVEEWKKRALGFYWHSDIPLELLTQEGFDPDKYLSEHSNEIRKRHEDEEEGKEDEIEFC